VTLIERTVRERILIVGVVLDGTSRSEVEEQLDELALLVDTAGADVVGRVIQQRNRPDPATFVGKGKASELYELSEALDVDTVVFDEELSPAQQRNLEKILGRTAIDRTAVILDVFAQNARSQEGKVQVEMALLRYRLPRLAGRGHAFSQQVGRIGTRGPGETKLEEDRRRIQNRISQLRAELNRLERTRDTQRKARSKSRAFSVTLVGYTNVGKSSLLAALTGADVLVENRLFATLDPRTRKLKLPGGETITITDTVGFIRKLPHELVEAFRSTLETVVDADLLVHVVDASSRHLTEQMREVEETLARIGAGEKPQLIVYNKVDQAEPGFHMPQPGIAVSAADRYGLDDLLVELAKALRGRYQDRIVFVPYSSGHLLALIHREAEVIEERPVDGGVEVVVRVDRAAMEMINRELRNGRYLD
jgi:GTP-binding protein HflX